jgi:hypothetical protein
MRLTTGHITKAALLLAVGVALVAAAAPARAQDVPRHPANVSLFYPISTNQDPTILTYFRLNLLYGRVGYIKGVDIGTIVNRTDRDMRGVQLTGIYSQTGIDMSGAALTGGISYVGGNARGIQLTGLANFNRGGFTGLQYAFLFNFVERDFSGVQVTSLFNLNSGDSRYVQLSAVANLTAGSCVGGQVAGFINYTNDRLSGVQAGVMNIAGEFRGAQIGALNVAGEASGTQIGIVNWSEQINGVPVGVVNLTGEGAVSWATYASNVALANTGIRTVVRRYTSTFAVGIGDVEEDRDDTVFFSWYYGYGVPLGEGARWWLTPELGYVHVMPQSSEEGKINDLHFMLQALVKGEVQLGDVTRLFVGGGVSVRFSEYSTDATTETDPLVLAGVSLW